MYSGLPDVLDHQMKNNEKRNTGSCRPHFFILALMLFSICDIYQHTSCFYEYSVEVTLLPFIFSARFATPLRSLSCTRKRTFTTSRIPYSVTGTSSFQLVLKSVDIHPNPGPYRKRSNTAKYPCGECQRTVTNKGLRSPRHQ